MTTPTKEAAVRTAASKLLDAIRAANKEGLVIAWPSDPEGLATIAISETARAEVATTITVTVDGLDPDSAEATKAQNAAQKAVDDVVSPPATK